MPCECADRLFSNALCVTATPCGKRVEPLRILQIANLRLAALTAVRCCSAIRSAKLSQSDALYDTILPRRFASQFPAILQGKTSMLGIATLQLHCNLVDIAFLAAE